MGNEPTPEKGANPDENEATGVGQSKEPTSPFSSPSPIRRYKVWRQGRAVLVFTTKPGYLGSTGLRSPNDPLPSPHPFLSASSLDAFTEHELRLLLLRAASVEDVLRLLHESGFEVVEES